MWALRQKWSCPSMLSILQPVFLRLLNEALVLQAKHGLYKSCPLRPTVHAMQALLAYRAGAAGVHDTLDWATAAFIFAKYVM